MKKEQKQVVVNHQDDDGTFKLGNHVLTEEEYAKYIIVSGIKRLIVFTNKGNTLKKYLPNMKSYSFNDAM